MPFIDDPVYSGLHDQVPLPTKENFPVEQATPGLWDVFSSELQQSNSVASTYSSEAGIGDGWSAQPFDPDFSLGDSIKGTKWENRPGLFVTARNRAHFDAIVRDVEREEANAELISRSSWPTYLTSMLASQALDPINWLSLGTVGALKVAANTGRGLTLASRTGAIAAGVAADTALQEVILQGTQQTRTVGESLASIGGSMFLGGLIGHVGSRLLLRTEVDALSRMIEREMADFSEGFDGPLGSGTAGRGSSVGAAANLGGDAPAPEMKFAFGLDYLSHWVGPQQRLVASELGSTRRIANELIQMPYIMKGHADGNITAPRGDAMGMPGTVQNRIGSVWEGDIYGVLTGMRDAFLEYRGAEHSNFVSRGMMSVSDRMGRNGTEMSEVAFRHAVTDAINNGGVHEVPQVAKAAKMALDLSERIREAGLKSGALKEGQSPIPRKYLTPRVTAERPKFREIVMNHLRRERGRYEGELDTLMAEQRAKAAEAENLTAEQRSMREMDRLRDQAARDAERAEPIRYEGLPLDDGEISTVAETWRYINEVRARPKPETLVQYLIRTGGVLDQGGEVSHLTGGNRGRPGLVRKDDSVAGQGGLGGLGDAGPRANTLDDVTMRAWEEGFFSGRQPGVGERPGIDEFLELLRDDLHHGSVVRDADSLHLEDLKIADEMERELLDSYGISARDFRKETSLRKFFGQRTGAADEAAGTGAKVSSASEAGAEPKLTAEQQRIDRRARDTDADLLNLADEIIDRIVYAKEGRLSHDLHTKTDAEGFIREDAVLSPRDFDIPYNEVKDFLERDFETLIRMAHRSLIPDIEIAARFGDTGMTAAIREVLEDARARTNVAADAKERARIEKAAKADIADLVASRDRIAGRYGIPDDPAAGMVRAGRFARDASVMTKMGMAAFTSIPETARIITARGLSGVFADLLYPLMRSWSKAIESGADLRIATHAMDHYTASRAMAMADGAEDWGGIPKLDKFSREATKFFMRATFLPKLTDWQQSAGGFLAGKTILEATEALADGRLTPKQRTYLSRLGISDENARTIAEQFRKHGVKDDSRVWAAEADSWDEGTRAAREAFLGGVRAEVDRMITRPGLETPNMSQNEVGKIFFQFKSFGIAAYERVLVSGIQHNDVPFWTSVVTAMALAMMVNEGRKAIFDSNSGKKQKSFAERWNDPKGRNQMFIDAVDKSGVLGWLLEPNTILDRTMGAGLSAQFGTPPQKKPTIGDPNDFRKQLAGPAIATGLDLASVLARGGASALKKYRWTEADTRRLESVTPFIGIHWLRLGLEALDAEQGFNRAVGAKRSAR